MSFTSFLDYSNLTDALGFNITGLSGSNFGRSASLHAIIVIMHNFGRGAAVVKPNLIEVFYGVPCSF